MDAGLAAVLGALVGGMIPGAIALRAEHEVNVRALAAEKRSDERLRSSLSRVAHGQFTTSEAVLFLADDTQSWWAASLDVRFALSYDDRKALAETLDPETWSAVDLAARMLEIVYLAHQKPRTGLAFDHEATEVVKTGLETVTRATTLLEKTCPDAILPLNRDAYRSSSKSA